MNPSVSLGMACLGRLSYAGLLGRTAAQLLGAVAGHLLLERLSSLLGLPLLSGPSLTSAPLTESCRDEAVATFLLLAMIWGKEALFGKKMWLFQELLMIVVVRLNLSLFNKAGPAGRPVRFGMAELQTPLRCHEPHDGDKLGSLCSGPPPGLSSNSSTRALLLARFLRRDSCSLAPCWLAGKAVLLLSDAEGL
eukprot:g33421.t1